jgi:nucleosome binding factor SPN SPT16 subunit
VNLFAQRQIENNKRKLDVFNEIHNLNQQTHINQEESKRFEDSMTVNKDIGNALGRKKKFDEGDVSMRASKPGIMK